MSESENVIVICWENGTLGNVFFEPREIAIKRCLAHNLEELWNFADDGGLDDNTKEVVLKIIDLMKNDKWEEANKMWQDEDMSSLDDEYSNQMEWHHITEPEDVSKTLEWTNSI